ncbi:hypothetical protein D5b_00037 [Faustovirus]|nr:hypothetical protein D5b_00037 [Faustovirus]AMN84872.1 hypothetical protein D6_00473 [Faustovirus]AMP43996.1 hypothetical protein PRJ_Dakar_00036 [Faustovirus]
MNGLPDETLTLVLNYVICGRDKVLRAQYRMVCVAFSQAIKPIRIRYVLLNAASITHKHALTLAYAYNYNPHLCEFILNKYAYKNLRVEFDELYKAYQSALMNTKNKHCSGKINAFR